MNNNFILPETTVLNAAKHMLDAIKIGNDLDEDEKLFFLDGGSLITQKDVAGSITYGMLNKNEKKEPNGLNEYEIIQNELDELLMPSIEKKEKVVKNNNNIYFRLIELSTMKIENTISLNVMQHMTDNSKKQNANEFDAVFIYGNIDDDLNNEVDNFIEKQILNNKYNKPIFIALTGICESRKRKYSFEYNAKIVKVIEPDFSYYEKVFTNFLSSKNKKLEKGTEALDVISMIKSYRTDNFSVDDFNIAIDKACKRAAKDKREVLRKEDFDYFINGYVDPEEKLKFLVGMSKIKKKIDRLIKLNIFNMKKYGPFYAHSSYNIAFAGNSGVGKTEVAILYSEILAKYGISNGKCRIACKNDYVGTHIGQTAEKMKKLFQGTRGGVIFFDEAATFLTDDCYAQEALTELVRFMEMYHDVICIFASYEENIEKLLKKDDGLRSRISEVIVFDNYTNDELYEILERFCIKEDFTLENSKNVLNLFWDEQRILYPQSFGNARLARNVFEKAKEIIATDCINNNLNLSDASIITSDCIKQTIQELKENSSISVEKKLIGFCVNND